MPLTTQLYLSFCLDEWLKKRLCLFPPAKTFKLLLKYLNNTGSLIIDSIGIEDRSPLAIIPKIQLILPPTN